MNDFTGRKLCSVLDRLIDTDNPIHDEAIIFDEVQLCSDEDSYCYHSIALGKDDNLYLVFRLINDYDNDYDFKMYKIGG